MKQTIRWILVSVVACAICSLAAYHRGYESGYRNATYWAIGRCHFEESIAFFAALQKLRTGDIPATTRQMEASCFDSAHIFYKDPTHAGAVSRWGQAEGWATWPNAQIAKEVAQDLIKYRATYRTNSADWDIMEQKLAVELTKVK